MAKDTALVRAVVQMTVIDLELSRHRREQKTGGGDDVRAIGLYEAAELDGTLELVPETRPRASREQVSHVRRNQRWELEAVSAMDPDYIGAAMRAGRSRTVSPRQAARAYEAHSGRPGVFRRENGRLIAIG